jgi:hypothetical protein
MKELFLENQFKTYFKGTDRIAHLSINTLYPFSEALQITKNSFEKHHVWLTLRHKKWRPYILPKRHMTWRVIIYSKTEYLRVTSLRTHIHIIKYYNYLQLNSGPHWRFRFAFSFFCGIISMFSTTTNILILRKSARTDVSMVCLCLRHYKRRVLRSN